MRTKPKYLVRPRDSHIFELDESNGCYRSWTTRNVTYADGTRPNAMLHFTFENLTENYGFIPADESELDDYQKKNEFYMRYLSWSSRPDGHGGVKGGTMEEFIKLYGGTESMAEEMHRYIPKCRKPDDHICSRPWGRTCRDLRCDYFK